MKGFATAALFLLSVGVVLADPAAGSLVRGGQVDDIHRQLQNEWACVEIDVDNLFDGIFCEVFRDAIDNFPPGLPRSLLRFFIRTERMCCPGDGSLAAECCRCNRQPVGDSIGRFVIFRSLTAQGVCSGIFEGGNPEDPTFVTATEVAPGQLKQMLGF